MKYRKAIFVVAYCFEKGEVSYLILKRKLHWKGWEFPKGGVEKGESLIDAAKRELKEETGLKAEKLKRFFVNGKYKYNRKFTDRPGFCGQTYQLFSARVKKGKVKLDKKEHEDFKWMNYETARKKLKWTNQKKCLKIVDESLR